MKLLLSCERRDRTKSSSGCVHQKKTLGRYHRSRKWDGCVVVDDVGNDNNVVGESANANWNHAKGVSRDENVAQKRARVGVR